MPSRTSSRRNRAAYAAATALVLAVGLAGCGSGTDDDASPDPSTDPSATESTSQATTETPTDTASTPSAAPATGPEIAVRGLRANAPDGWEAKRPYVVMSAAVPLGALGTTVYVFRFPNSGTSMDELAQASRRQTGWQFKLRRLDDLELDSQTAFHLAGKVNPGEYMEKFGAILNDDRLMLTFEFHNGEDKATRDEIISSVLATVDFREITK